MKRIKTQLFVPIIVLFVLLFAGCSGRISTPLETTNQATVANPPIFEDQTELSAPQGTSAQEVKAVTLDDFSVVIRTTNQSIELWDELSKASAMFPYLEFFEERYNGGFILRDYYANGIIFSVSAFTPVYENALISSIRILSTNFTTRRGITVGATREQVIAVYGMPDYRFPSGTIMYDGITDLIETFSLVFQFDEEDIVVLIRMSSGT